MRLIFVGLFSTATFLLALLEPVPPEGERAAVSGPRPRERGRCLTYESSALNIPGAVLTQRQLERGFRKPLEREFDRDQSFEGLRDIIDQSRDPKIKAGLRTVEKLEDVLFDQPTDGEPHYQEGLIKDFSPLAVFIQEETGLPASIIMAQLAVESGWASSNVTILKNNVMGLGNCRAPETFTATLDFGGFKKEIPVTCMLDTTAFKFENVADSIFYYTYAVLQSEDNEAQYGELRRYIRENRRSIRFSPKVYRKQVVSLLAEGYHENPGWYSDYILSFTEDLAYLDRARLCR